MTFANWIDTFLTEKGIEADDTVSATGNMGLNIIPVAALVDLMKSAPRHEQDSIKDMLVKIDLTEPGRKPVLDYFSHLAQAVAL